MFPLVLLAISVFSGEPGLPVCRADNVGLLWPIQANSDPAVLHKLSRDGMLWICSWGRWRHQWKRASVNVRVLRLEKASLAAKRKPGPAPPPPPPSTEPAPTEP